MILNNTTLDEYDAIEVVGYEEKWGEDFQAEREALESVLLPQPVSTEHIGSTSVTGLAAKPVIDIMLGIEGYGGGVEFDEQIASLGYVHVSEPQQLLPCTRFFLRRDHQCRRSHHLHLVELNSEFWNSRLLFRDNLRRNAAVALVYAELKKMGAAAHRHDRKAYNAFKASFITACINSA